MYQNDIYPKIVGIVGPIRAGKTTIANILVDLYGYQLGSNSDYLRDILSRMRINASRSALQNLGDALFSVLGNDTLARARIAQMQKQDGNYKLVIDGIRYIEEVKLYKNYSNFKLLAVDAIEEDRFARSRTDQLKDENKDIDEFQLLANNRSEMEVPMIMEMADEKVMNTGDIESLKVVVENFMNNWRLRN